MGDVDPKTFIASVRQFDSPEKVQAVLDGDAHQGLKNLLSRLEIADLVRKTYKARAIYVTNESSDDASKAYEANEPMLKVYDRQSIAANFIDANQGIGVSGEFQFNLSYVEPLRMTIGTAADGAEVFLFPARALELVALGGIADTSLFTKNVRYDLGSGPVKGIPKAMMI